VQLEDLHPILQRKRDGCKKLFQNITNRFNEKVETGEENLHQETSVKRQMKVCI